jgi:hypothetical protein
MLVFDLKSSAHDGQDCLACFARRIGQVVD